MHCLKFAVEFKILSIWFSFYFIFNSIKSFPYSNNPPLSTTQPWELLKRSWKLSMIFLSENSSQDVWNIQLVKVAIWKHFVEVILHLPSYRSHWQFVKNLIFLKVPTLSDVNNAQTNTRVCSPFSKKAIINCVYFNLKMIQVTHKQFPKQ